VAAAEPSSDANGYAVELVDAEGDDHGPGTYTYPLDGRLPKGSLDLTSLALRPDGDELVLRACFRARPRRIKGVHVSRYESVDLLPQVIDVYLDSDPSGGLEQALPGRNVRLEPGFAWEHVLVVTERAPLFRSWLGHVAPEMDRRLTTQRTLGLKRRCVVARLQLPVIGPPKPGWGVLAVVTGARFYPTFRIGDRLTGAYSRDEFTRAVEAVAGFCGHQDDRTFDCAFGGCSPCGGHPYVLDALGCRADAKALAAYDRAAGRLATLAGVRLDGRGRGECPPPASPALSVQAAGVSGTSGRAESGALPGRAPASGAAAGEGRGYRVAAVSPTVVTVVGGPPLPPGTLLAPHGGAAPAHPVLVVTGRAGPVTLAQRVGGETRLHPGQAVRALAPSPPAPEPPPPAPAPEAPPPARETP